MAASAENTERPHHLSIIPQNINVDSQQELDMMANEQTHRGESNVILDSREEAKQYIQQELCSNSSGEERFESQLGNGQNISNYQEKALAVLLDNRIDATNSIME